MKVSTIYSPAGVEIMTQPFLVGKKLEKLAQSASEDFVRSLDLPADAEPVSLEILNGGHYYFCADACKAVTGRDCKVSTLRAKRGHDSAETYGGEQHWASNVPEGTTLWESEGSDWCVRIWENTGIPSGAGPLLVGDTVATGTTLAGVLEFCVHEMGQANCYQDIHVFSIVGASSWTDIDGADGGIATKLQGVDQTLAANGKTLTVTFANAQFALQPNGTDLAFTGADMLPEASVATEAKLGGFAAKMKCAVWDWGDRFREIEHHLEEIHEYYGGLPDCPAWLMEGIETARAEQATAGGGSGGAEAKVAS